MKPAGISKGCRVTATPTNLGPQAATQSSGYGFNIPSDTPLQVPIPSSTPNPSDTPMIIDRHPAGPLNMLWREDACLNESDVCHSLRMANYSGYPYSEMNSSLSSDHQNLSQSSPQMGFEWDQIARRDGTLRQDFSSSSALDFDGNHTAFILPRPGG